MSSVIGKVINIDGLRITVEIDMEACSRCQHEGHCRIADTADKQTVTAYNYEELEMKPGDSVEIASSPSRIVLLSMLLYFFPVLLLITGAAAGYWISGSELYSALTGIAGGIAAFTVIYAIDRKYGQNFKHKITRVIK
ncbi:MAG: SoxR reducing system RseC family protein [bacterium]